MNALKQRREILERTLKLALDQLEQVWENETSKAEPAKFQFELKVFLTDGTEIISGPVGHFGTSKAVH